MLYNVIFICILSTLIYSYISSRNQFAATATAIREIWSGGCQLACRPSSHSSYSGFSGLSGLQGPPRALGQNTMKSNPALGQGQLEAHVTEPSSNCNCESCPCALIENFLRTCQPATNIYAELTRCTERCATYFRQMLAGTRNFGGSDENFNFGRGDIEIPAGNVKKLPDNLQQHSKKLDIALTLNNDTSEQEGTSKQIQVLKEIQNDVSNNSKVKAEVSKHIQSSDNSTAEKGFCPKCIEKGKSCSKFCPNRKNTAIPTKESVTKLVLQQHGKIAVPTMNITSEPVPQQGSSKDTPRILESSEESMSDKGFCSKCIDKGRVCLKHCPRAKSNGKKG